VTPIGETDGMDATSGSINTLVRFCARRDVPTLTPGPAAPAPETTTPATTPGRPAAPAPETATRATTPGPPADVAILFGGSILAGAAEFAAAVRAGAAAHTMIVGGRGHTTAALATRLGEAMGWPDAVSMSEAALFDRYLRTRWGIAVDLLEEESTNCGNNVTNALALLRREGLPHNRLILIQDATMQQRMDAGFRRHAPAAELVNFAAHRTLVDDDLTYVDPPDGMWELDHYVSLLMGEVPRLTDDANGYGPAGRGFIAHVDVPGEVHRAYDHLRRTDRFATRVADDRWAG
jgi:hypothetical protein